MPRRESPLLKKYFSEEERSTEKGKPSNKDRSGQSDPKKAKPKSPTQYRPPLSRFLKRLEDENR